MVVVQPPLVQPSATSQHHHAVIPHQSAFPVENEVEVRRTNIPLDINDGEYDDEDDEDDGWKTAAQTADGGTASDPEALSVRLKSTNAAKPAKTRRKRRVRWDADPQATLATSSSTSSPPHPPSHRRRTRSMSGAELFDYKASSQSHPLDRRQITEEDLSRASSSRPAPFILPQLPRVEGGWQTTPFTGSKGIPIIIKRPTMDDLNPDVEPPTRSSLDSSNDRGAVVERPDKGDREEPSKVSPLEPPAIVEIRVQPSLTPQDITINISPSIPPGGSVNALDEKPLEEPITSPSSPAFPPLPTPSAASASSLTTSVPKPTIPSFLQSPKPSPPLIKAIPTPSIGSTKSVDWTSQKSDQTKTTLATSSFSSIASDGLYKSRIARQNSINSQSHSQPHSHPYSSTHQQQQAKSTNRRPVFQKPNLPTRPYQPNPPNLASSPRSPAFGRSVSPRTPQSSFISSAPLPPMPNLDDQPEVVVHPDSPPWQTVGSGIVVTSPRMKGHNSDSLNILGDGLGGISVTHLAKSPPITPFTSVHLQIDELPNEEEDEPVLPTTSSSHTASPRPTPAEQMQQPSEQLKTRLDNPLPNTTVTPITPISVTDVQIPVPESTLTWTIELEKTPPLNPNAPILSPDEIEDALAKAFVPWPIRLVDGKPVLPPRKVVKRVERGEWYGLNPDNIPKESALWRLVRAQRLWLSGHKELFKLKHPSGLPKDHKSPKIQYVDDGEPLRAIEIIVQSILLDPRVVAFKSPEARKDFTEQLSWQIFADAKFTGWPELSNVGADLDVVFAKANEISHGPASFLSGGVIGTRRALASFIRNHIALAILEEQDGHTQHAIFKYGRALDTIDWVNQSLGPAPERILYGRGDAKERIEAVYEPVFGRGVQIRLGHTIIAQYNFIKRNKDWSLLRNDLLTELLTGSTNLFQSVSAKVVSPYTQKGLKLDVYISDYVYHIAHAFFFQGFYARENGKVILGMGCNSPRGGRPASVVARERSIASAQAFIQAAFLFPEDEETRIECFEMGLEELLKVGGIRVGEALAMYTSLEEALLMTNKVWNHLADEEEDGEEVVPGLFDDDATVAAKKKKKKKKKKKEDATETAVAAPPGPPIQVENPVTNTDLTTPKAPSPINLTSPPPTQTPKISFFTPGHGTVQIPASGKFKISSLSPSEVPSRLIRAAILQSWFKALQRSQEEKRIMHGDVLHPAPSLIYKPEVVWKDVFDDGDELEDEDPAGGIPWASWGMRSVKATKWEDLTRESAKGARASKDPLGNGPDGPSQAASSNQDKDSIGITTEEANKVIASTDTEKSTSRKASPTKDKVVAKPAGRLWERPTPWSVINRIAKQKLFTIDLDAFNGMK
ncbi:hypothetical protein CPB86DRAFT_523831 [Serendipita vermifera]|nr:hypothetical protein CPB86DRAFT_523831 [Serendipita vermifera]